MQVNNLPIPLPLLNKQKYLKTLWCTFCQWHGLWWKWSTQGSKQTVCDYHERVCVQLSLLPIKTAGCGRFGLPVDIALDITAALRLETVLNPLYINQLELCNYNYSRPILIWTSHYTILLCSPPQHTHSIQCWADHTGEDAWHEGPRRCEGLHWRHWEKR